MGGYINVNAKEFWYCQNWLADAVAKCLAEELSKVRPDLLEMWWQKLVVPGLVSLDLTDCPREDFRVFADAVHKCHDALGRGENPAREPWARRLYEEVVCRLCQMVEEDPRQADDE